MSFNITDEFLVLYIKFPNHGFSMNCGDKEFNIDKNLKYDGCQRVPVLMVYKSFNKKTASVPRSETLAMRNKSASRGAVESEIMSNQELAEELHKPIFKKFEK